MWTNRTDRQVRGTDGRRPGFTLIELLVVIAVIGILATLVIGVMGYASRTSKIKRVEAELKKLETAIKDYKATLGTYPPDTVVNPNSQPVQIDPKINSLFFELSGTYLDSDRAAFSTPLLNQRVPSATINQYFNRPGFANATRSEDSVRNFVPWLEPSQHRSINQDPRIDVLVAPLPWPLNRNDNPIGNTDINPWRYVSTNPTNNPATFDLWAEVVIGDEIEVIGNWEE